ncbi:MAG: phosphate/phosphite/phosphonate ABC transporter substrate-binding protein [Deltaproteobacteria bacterium]|nr:phosphate/phosphite/phosphonate ABC transporter substrate-binding protein [Deltaproteobacteria bacterium]
MKKYWTGLLLLSLLCWLVIGNAEAGSLDFVVIQPGQPGTETEARPVMDALARYIQQKMGSGESLKGVYFNRMEPALAFLNASPPTWGITQLGVYVQHGKGFQMTPVAATRPGGFEKDVWYLMTRKDGPPKWQSLKGEIQGNMLFEKRAAACLLFELPVDRLPFTLKGTFRPLRSSRSAAKGKITGVVLDRIQYETVKTMSVGQKIKVVQTSRDLPTSPVVWFGPVTETAKKLAGVLQGMKEDVNAAKLLTLLQTTGFGPADPDLLRFRLSEKADACFTP